MKKSLAIYLLLTTLNILFCKSIQAQEFQLTFSVADLEKYLGESVPANARLIDTDLWIIELFNDNFIRQNIYLLSENDVVIVAEYLFTSGSNSWLSGLRESLFNIIDEHAENKTINNNVINWEIKPNSGLRNNKYLLIGLTDIYAGGNNENRNFSVRILDLYYLQERQGAR
jgi:hypothetical protein